ncbi:hypothetical protein AVEN_239750-1 [Araneus ventricosus]|uniref:Uncharacterized protein n=1 Tax=Araneus ventricosus TaxID=182803 RepID=A0A4Y2TV83_ARAVE|nr:hypothetical protein AVEN_239750-1 [Araneus ventricosus]
MLYFHRTFGAAWPNLALAPINPKPTNLLKIKCLAQHGQKWLLRHKNQPKPNQTKPTNQPIVSLLPETKGPAEDVISPLKSWELFNDDNMIHLIVSKQIYIARNTHHTLHVKEMSEK